LLTFKINDEIVNCIELPGFELKMLYDGEKHRYFLLLNGIGTPEYYIADIDSTGYFTFTRLEHINIAE